MSEKSILEEFKKNQKIAFDNPVSSLAFRQASIKMDDLWIYLSKDEEQIVQEYERSLWIESGRAIG